MRDGLCPKCGSHGVYRGPRGFAQQKEGNFIATGFLSAVRVTRYVCVGCGYIEDYLDNPADRDAIREAFDKVSPGSQETAPSESSTEALNCLSCGLPMPSYATTCAGCGWSWESEPKAE